MLYCPNFFWNVLQVWMTGKDVYLQMTWSWPDKTWNILCSYCLQWNTSQSKFRNHYFLFLFAFSILSQLFLIWGCRLRGAFPSKTNILHCVFRPSDVRSKWWLLCSLLHPTTKHLNHLGDSLRSKVKRHCQSTIVGGAWVCVTSHSQESEIGLIWERGYYLWGFKKKNTGWIFIRGAPIDRLPITIGR